MPSVLNRSLLFAVLSSALSSLAWIYQGFVVQSLGPLLTASSLGVAAGLVLLLYLFAKKNLPTLQQIAENKKDLILLIAFRAVFASAMFSLALAYTSGMRLMFFTKLEPYFVLFYAWLFQKQKIRLEQLGLLLVHIVGAFILSTDGKFEFDDGQLGDILTVVTVGVLAATYAPASRVSSSIGAIKTNSIVLLSGGFILLPFALCVSPMLPWEMPKEGWINLAITIGMFHILGLSLWYASLKELEGWIASALRAAGPVIAAPIGYFLFNLVLTPLQIWGAVLVLVTSALIALENHKFSAKTK